MGFPSMPEERARLQPATPPDEIILPAPQLTVLATPERQFPIRHRDWLQLRRKVSCLSDPFPNLANVGWACVGIAASVVTAYFPWIAAYSQLTLKAQQHYAYISPLLAVLATANTVVALFSFFVNHKMARIKATSVENVLVDMDEIYEPYEIVDAPKPSLPNARKHSI